MTFFHTFFRAFFYIFFYISIFGASSVFASNYEKNLQIDSLSISLHTRIDTMKWENAISYCNSLLDNKKTTKQESFIINKELSKGFVEQSDYFKALKYAFNALSIAQSMEDTFLIAISNSQIGSVYYRLKKFDKTKDHLTLAINTLSQYGKSKYLANAYYKMAVVLEDSKEISKAYKYYMLALDIFKDKGSCMDMADVYNGLASWNYRQRKIDKTAFYANKALEKFLECGNKKDIAAMYTNIAALYNLQKKHNQAIDYNFKAIEIANEIGALNQLSEAYLNLSQTYAYINDYKKAFEYHILYDKYNDSIFSLETNKHLIELTTTQETAKKEKEIAEHKAILNLKDGELKNTKIIRNLLFILIILVVITSIIIYIRLSERRKFLVELKKRNDELKASNEAKDKLFSIISHDLSSPISSFTRIIETMDSSFDNISKEDLKDYISSIHQSSCNIRLLLNNLLQWALKQSGHFVADKERLALGNLISSSYACQLQIAKEKDIDIHFDKPKDIFVKADAKMIGTVIRNVVSNAVKFSPKNSSIDIKVEEADSKVKIKVVDRGEGMSDEDIDKLFKVGQNTNSIGNNKQEKGSGLGLMLSKELLDLNTGEISAKRNEFGGMSFIITLNKDK